MRMYASGGLYWLHVYDKTQNIWRITIELHIQSNFLQTLPQSRHNTLTARWPGVFPRDVKKIAKYWKKTFIFAIFRRLFA